MISRGLSGAKCISRAGVKTSAPEDTRSERCDAALQGYLAAIEFIAQRLRKCKVLHCANPEVGNVRELEPQERPEGTSVQLVMEQRYCRVSLIRNEKYV